MDCRSVHVALGDRSYQIQIGSGFLDQPELLSPLGWSHAVLICDQAITATHGQRLHQNLAAQGRVDLIEVPSGESSKSLDEAQRLWQTMLDMGADRKSLVVAMGGGVVGDLAGFIAATFARGLAFVQVPTTLLAQVDSSVGGKVAINLPTAKNMVGAFWQPAHVCIDTDTLATLPQREYISGLAEVVKYGVIMDPAFFGRLEQDVDAILDKDPTVVARMIARCCELKAQVVEEDEQETSGRRAILNYGHTFAHALEAVGGYGALLHGEAVAIGMLCASRLAESLGMIDSDVTDRQHQLLTRLGLPTDVPALDTELLLSAMQRDKKVEHGKLHFILPTCLGHVQRVGDVETAAVQAALTG